MSRHFKPEKLVGRYRSKSEQRVAEHLEHLGVPYLYEPQDRKVPYLIERAAFYLPDFVLLGDEEVILEVKGYFTSADRAKYLRIRKSNPLIDLRFVFDRATTRLSKTSKTTYAQWAEKHGFLWCEKVIPPDWYESKKVTKNARASSKATGPKDSKAPRKVLHLSHGGLDGLRRVSTRRLHS